jgi:hypothetical protein
MAENWFWSRPVIVNGNVYAGCLDGNVYILKANTGEKVSAVDLGSPVASDPVIVDNSVVFATRKGVIHSINTISNEDRMLADIDKEVDGPLAARDSIVYVQTNDLALQRINASTGAVLSPVSLKGQN